ARHQIARAALLVVPERLLLEPRKKIVPNVVLDIARGTDDDAAHEEQEHPAHERDAKEQPGIQPELLARDSAVQVVDGELEDPWGEQLKCRRVDDEDQSKQKRAAITAAVRPAPADLRLHLSSGYRTTCLRP